MANEQLMKEIRENHDWDRRDFDLKPLLDMIDTILGFSPFDHGTQTQVKALKDEAPNGNIIPEMLSYTVNRISAKMNCNCFGKEDALATTKTVFSMLRTFSWDAMAVLALAAFAVNYGEFWMVIQLDDTDLIGKAVGFLKDMPGIQENANTLKPELEELKIHIKAMVDIIKCIIEFKKLPPQCITPDTPQLKAANLFIPDAVYWTILSLVACNSRSAGLIGRGHEFIKLTVDGSELSKAISNVSNSHKNLQTYLSSCNQYIADQILLEKYKTLEQVFRILHTDNLKPLKALINPKNIPELVEGQTNKRVSIDVLKGKYVLLLISDLDISELDLSMLEMIYNDPWSRRQTEMLWLPIVDRWNEAEQKHFESLRSRMSCYSLNDQLEPAAIKFIKDNWHFNKKHFLLVMDPQGTIVNPNAIPMMWIWGSFAFPYTSVKEKLLWEQESWRIELLVNGLWPIILNWIREDKYICLYGGEDIEWIRRFTITAKAVANAARIGSFEMFYVGKSNPGVKVRNSNAAISAEKLSHVYDDLTAIWFFWVRLEYMLYSRVQLGNTVENDKIMQEVMTLLTSDSGDQGWALMVKGNGEEMANAKGNTILRGLMEFEEWKETARERGFIYALNEYMTTSSVPVHCNRLILPGVTGNIPERLLCGDCGNDMERYVMYRCCTESGEEDERKERERKARERNLNPIFTKKSDP